MTRKDMTAKITETRMSSDATPHTATARPVPGEPTLWSVTWLPGRTLTRDQAITAMTIAETVTARPVDQNGGRPLWRPHLESWAAELGLSADEAAEMALAPPDRGEDKRQRTASPAPVRTNHVGSLCPSWCTSDHAKVQVHMSDPVTSSSPGEPQVKIVQWGSGRYHSEPPAVTVFKGAALVQLSHADAEGLADLLEELADGSNPDQLRKLADEVHAAATVIDPARHLAATVAEISADREAQ